MKIDCDECPVRGHACGDCVVTVLLGVPDRAPVEFDGAEQVAIARLARAGLVPPLRGSSERPPLRVVGSDEHTLSA
jgi:hypothetical protein